MSKRVNISSGSEWEGIIGYSRGVKIGNVIELSGTTAMRNGKLVGEGDPYEQTKCALSIIKESLKEAGAEIKDVVRTRIFMKDISQWEAVGKAHGEVFKDIKPATTILEVSKLISSFFFVDIFNNSNSYFLA
ncbi:MAG: RidA family protein [Cyclobacteriaceae bacterium]|nr:RidA family protein [Cyclobacteriaceae bacterium]